MGGGLAGLYAAYQLEQANIPYVLLEAQARFGGRILSLPAVQDAAFGVDLGPTWFWPHQARMMRLCDEMGIRIFEQYVAGDVLYHEDSAQATHRRAGAVAMLSYRLEGGMQSLVTAVAARLSPRRLKQAHPVTKLERREDGWLVTASHTGEPRQFVAQRLVLAAPPRKLIQHLDLSQWLPARLSDALSATPTWMAAQAKFVAVYATPFWRHAGLSGQVFSRVGPMAEIHDASVTSDSGFALFGFIGVPASVRSQHSMDALKEACIRQLINLFGVEARKPAVTYLKDWAQDDWVVSNRDLGESPQHPDLNLSRWLPELNRLKLDFVGSEFSSEEGGYLEGALCAVEAFKVSSGIADYFTPNIVSAGPTASLSVRFRED